MANWQEIPGTGNSLRELHDGTYRLYVSVDGAAAEIALLLDRISIFAQKLIDQTNVQTLYLDFNYEGHVLLKTTILRKRIVMVCGESSYCSFGFDVIDMLLKKRAALFTHD